MSDQEGTTQEKSSNTFDMSSCIEMMGKMTSQGGCGCDCGEMMSQVKQEGEIHEEWLGMMSQMVESCFGGGVKKDDAAEEVVEEA
jgi:hypothetical protein